MSRQSDQPSSRHSQHSDTINKAEWASFGVALVLIIGIVGLLLYDWLGTSLGEPVLTIMQTEAIRHEQQVWYVPFKVQNTGGETVADVYVQVELVQNEQVLADAEQQINYLASGSQHKGAFILDVDPAQGELKFRVTSYQEP